MGQLVADVAGWADADVWDVEDEQLPAAAREHLRASDRPPAAPPPAPSLPHPDHATHSSL